MASSSQVGMSWIHVPREHICQNNIFFNSNHFMNQLDDSISIMFCLQMTNAVLMIQFFRVFQFFSWQIFNVSRVSGFFNFFGAIFQCFRSVGVWGWGWSSCRRCALRWCVHLHPQLHRGQPRLPSGGMAKWHSSQLVSSSSVKICRVPFVRPGSVMG